MRKKIILMVSLLALVIFIFPQTVGKQAWRDFFVVTGAFNEIDDRIQSLHKMIIGIESEISEILADTDRTDNLKIIFNIHEDYSIGWVNIRRTKVAELRQFLEDEGYIH